MEENQDSGRSLLRNNSPKFKDTYRDKENCFDLRRVNARRLNVTRLTDIKLSIDPSEAGL
jgi:hypothetical protein